MLYSYKVLMEPSHSLGNGVTISTILAFYGINLTATVEFEKERRSEKRFRAETWDQRNVGCTSYLSACYEHF